MLTYCRTALCVPFGKKIGGGGGEVENQPHGVGRYPCAPPPSKQIHYVHVLTSFVHVL